jgi:hypothetical protein
VTVRTDNGAIVQARASERTGALVIRIWVEQSPLPNLKARVTRTIDVASDEEVTTGATSAEEIEAIVHAWLDSFVRSSDVGE